MVNLDSYQIPRESYLELKWFCRQYPRKKREVAMIGDGITSPQITGMPHGTGVSDPTFRVVMLREAAMRDVSLIECVAMETAEGAWYNALIRHCCYSVPFSRIEQHEIPTANRNAFFKVRKEFYYRLHDARMKAFMGGMAE